MPQPGNRKKIDTGKKCPICKGMIVQESVFAFGRTSAIYGPAGQATARWEEIEGYCCSRCGIEFRYLPK